MDGVDVNFHDVLTYISIESQSIDTATIFLTQVWMFKHKIGKAVAPLKFPNG